jgi:indole-3-glycerol phosphate synthase/phosphoribosylanthranilate isomerase
VARQLAGAAELPVVGVFRNAALADVVPFTRDANCAAVQLHGDEDARYINDLRSHLADGCEIWAAVAVADTIPPAREGSTRTLFDTAVAGVSGGTGHSFDWASSRCATIYLRGSSQAACVRRTQRRASHAGAWSLDVCSGVEARPGIKDHLRLAAFFDALRVPDRQQRSADTREGSLRRNVA